MFDEVRYGPTAAAYAVSPRARLATPSGELRRPASVWLLGFATLGLSWLVWYYRANRELRDFDPEIKVRPALAVLAVTLGALLVLPAVASLYNTGCRIAQAQRRAGLRGSSSGLRGLALGLVFGLTPFYYQSELNTVWVARN
jgi:hypothetical protein